MDTKIKGLDNLLRSSQNELRAYHDSALEQQRRSYLYAVVATWLGFFFILTGSVPYIVPIRVGDLALEGANALVVFSGVVINAVGALFFFMRRESLAQATYYYNRQRFGHSVALCYLMANGLDDAAKQKAVHVIIEKILDRNWGVERPVAPWSRSSKKNNLANQLFRK